MESGRVHATWIVGAFVVFALFLSQVSGAPADVALPPGIAPAFFPVRPINADVRYRTGVLVQFGAGNKSGSVAIKDESGRIFEYSIGRPIVVDGKRVHCASPPVDVRAYNPILCESGWPASIAIGSIRVRVYYWHAV